MNNQKGMTFIGMLGTMAVVIAGGLLVMRLVPVYIQYYTILSSVKGLNATAVSSLSGDPIADTEVLRSSLLKRLDINGIDYLKEDNVRITPDGTNKFKVQVKYQLVRPLAYNVSLLFDFNKTEEVVAGSEN
ncbi:MAG: DUF4845 domain-containing protein [Legionella sp.]|jgi:hypothetical protein